MPDSPDYDRLKAAFDGSVRGALPGCDYWALYTCQVVSQNADETLDLQPKRSDWPTQKNIPFRSGFPGVKFTVNPGAQVLLGWENGQPSIPYCGLWLTGAPGDLQTLQLNAQGQIVVGANATLAAARATDPVEPTPDLTSFFAAIVTALGTLGQTVTPPPSIALKIGSIGPNASTKVSIA